MPVTGRQQATMNRLRSLVNGLASESRRVCPPGYYIERALDQLEVVHMLLNKSVSHDWTEEDE